MHQRYDPAQDSGPATPPASPDRPPATLAGAAAQAPTSTSREVGATPTGRLRAAAALLRERTGGMAEGRFPLIVAAVLGVSEKTARTRIQAALPWTTAVADLLDHAAERIGDLAATGLSDDVTLDIFTHELAVADAILTEEATP